MRIPYEQPDETFPINVTNMIDVFLLLLIFFLVATTFAKAERDSAVQLPVAGAAQAISAPPRELVLNILENGRITLGGKNVSRQDLQAILKKAAAEDSTRKVLIRADKKAYMEHFADVTLIIRNAGFDEARIGYIPDIEDK
jgi:biopolymer transport protein ExbD